MSISLISPEEQQQALDLHNEARREAPGPPRPDLIWSTTLSLAAEEWGKQMVRKMRRQGHLQHDPRLRKKPYTMGENLFGGQGGMMTLLTAVRGWVREKEDYKGEPVTGNGRNRSGVMVGHYTQIICPQTTKVGMVKIKSRDWFYIVARYDGPQVIGSLPWGDSKHSAIRPSPSAHQEVAPVPHAGSSTQPKSKRSLPDREIQKILDLHNEARCEAPGGPRPDLIWSETLASVAARWARELARRNKGIPHENQNVMGENLAWSENVVQSYSSAVRDWVGEKVYYHGEAVGEEDPREEMVGHYTQIIYHPVTKVGMARVTRGRNTYIVARYDKIQLTGTRPWGSATHLPAGAINNHQNQESSRTHRSSREPESTRISQQRSHRSPRRERSMLEDIIDGMPRLVIKNSKVSFHPFGRRRGGSR
ncbi:CAP domain-containing protein [Cadophora sp. MPI-SDFR-AT-0126]|nr:CAP domain-containing protein [Leotiomycetes sp. MPI-SDFR-AT-0126]